MLKDALAPPRFTLNVKLIAGLLAIGCLIAAIGWLAMEMSRTVQRASRAILTENVSSLKAAEELEIALLNQKGIVSNYLLDGDAGRLELLEEKRRAFEQWLVKAQQVAFTPPEQRIMQRIGALYQEYDHQRSQVIKLYQEGSRLEARQLLLHRVNELMGQMYAACEELLLVNEQLIAASQRSSEQRVTRLQGVVWGGIAAAILLGWLAAWMIARRVTQRLLQSEQLATMGSLAGAVAHEVRNPLTAIKMRIHSLQDEWAASASGADDVAVIRQEIDRLERIVQNFLNLAKLPAPRLQPVSVHDVLANALRVLQPTLETQAIQVRRPVDAAPAVVQGDPDQLEQVFLNVLLNAVQAMPDGGTVVVATDVHAAGVEIAISDTGPGVPAKLRDKMFDPFFTTKANGAGLGLSVARKIVASHGGSITVRSGDETGTTIILRLPLAPSEVLVG